MDFKTPRKALSEAEPIQSIDGELGKASQTRGLSKLSLTRLNIAAECSQLVPSSDASEMELSE